MIPASPNSHFDLLGRENDPARHRARPPSGNPSIRGKRQMEMRTHG